MTTGTKRYGLRFKETRIIPTVEVTAPTIVSLSPYQVLHTPIKRFRGLSRQSAFNRALAWTRAHGDPR